MIDLEKNRPSLGPGGTEGGTLLFWLGVVLCGAAIVFFLGSVYVSSGMGMIRGAFHGRGGGGHGGGGGFWETTSMGVLFVPFLIGTIALFYNSKMTWAWILTTIGMALIFVEILSGLRFEFRMKALYLILMILIFSAGSALVLRSYFPVGKKESPD